jgi:hypothetical protein
VASLSTRRKADRVALNIAGIQFAGLEVRRATTATPGQTDKFDPFLASIPDFDFLTLRRRLVHFAEAGNIWHNGQRPIVGFGRDAIRTIVDDENDGAKPETHAKKIGISSHIFF